MSSRFFGVITQSGRNYVLVFQDGGMLKAGNWYARRYEGGFFGPASKIQLKIPGEDTESAALLKMWFSNQKTIPPIILNTHPLFSVQVSPKSAKVFEGCRLVLSAEPYLTTPIRPETLHELSAKEIKELRLLE